MRMEYPLAVVCLLAWVTPLLGQTGFYRFSTIAGTAGTVGSADGTNLATGFNYPGGLGVDASGNVYVSDILNHTIRELSRLGPDWIVSTVAGQALVPGTADGTNSDALFDRPNGLAVDEAGNLFVADHYNHTIRRLARSGTNWVVTTIAGLAAVHGSADGTNSNARFWSPTGVAVANGRVYVTDTANFTVRELAPAGTNWVVRTIAGAALNYGFVDGTNTDAQFDYPYGIAADHAGRLYVADWGNNAIRRLEAVGTDWVVTTIAGNSGVMGHDDGPGLLATFNFPNDLCADAAGSLYVADQSNDTIRKLVLTGADWVVSTIGGQALQAGAADGLDNQARFKHPWGIASDRSGQIYVSDYGNQTLRMGLFLPILQVRLIAHQVVLSWPIPAANYSVEVGTSLDPAAVWVPLTNAPVTNGMNLILSDQPTAPATFYRLRKP